MGMIANDGMSSGAWDGRQKSLPDSRLRRQRGIGAGRSQSQRHSVMHPVIQISLIAVAAFGGVIGICHGIWRFSSWGHRKLDSRLTPEQLAMEPKDPWRDN